MSNPKETEAEAPWKAGNQMLHLFNHKVTPVSRLNTHHEFDHTLSYIPSSSIKYKFKEEPNETKVNACSTHPSKKEFQFYL